MASSTTPKLGAWSRWKGIYLLTGICVGVGGVLLSWWGNPANSGICISCFMENTAGGLGLHGNVRMQYLRPELMAFVLGAFLTALVGRQVRSVSAGTFLLRFFVSIVLMIGCAVFIGCPIKLVLRLAAGDLTALAGAAGLAAGVYVGLKFVEGGFRIGLPQPAPKSAGYLIPGLMIALLALALLAPSFINTSVKGAGAQRAPVLAALGIGLLLGGLAHRSNFCVTAAIARVLLKGRQLPGCPKTLGMLLAIVAFFASALIANLALGSFSFGFVGQPSSNESYGWAFFAMLAVGFGSVLIKGCPFRQLVMAGSGDSDAGGAVLGMLVGAAMVQGWGLAGTAAGTPHAAKIAVLLSLGFLVVLALVGRERR